MTTMDRDLEYYVFHHFSHLMNADEKKAYSHLAGTMKSTLGRSDVSAQEEVKAGGGIHSRWLSDNPDVLRLASGGFEEFREKTAKRILAEHGDRVFLNCCPRCGALARTPKAQQCRFVVTTGTTAIQLRFRNNSGDCLIGGPTNAMSHIAGYIRILLALHEGGRNCLPEP
jgi:hypothetical protein